MQFYLLSLLAGVSALAEADPGFGCNLLKAKLGLCNNGNGQNQGGRATVIVYTSVTGNAATVTATAVRSQTATVTTQGGNSACQDGSSDGHGATCEGGTFVVTKTAQSTITRTLTNDNIVTPHCSTCTHYEDVCVTVSCSDHCR